MMVLIKLIKPSHLQLLMWMRCQYLRLMANTQQMRISLQSVLLLLTDPEGGGDITFTFGDGNSVIQVTSVSGILSFVTNHFEDGAPNYEGTGTYPFDGDYNTAVGCSGNGDDNYILIATDENGNATRQNICVQINNLK